MTLDHYTTGRKKFKHLTIAKRGQIEALLKLGVSKVEIAKQVGISRSTLYEELKRGTVDQLASDLKTHKKYFAETDPKEVEDSVDKALAAWFKKRR